MRAGRGRLGGQKSQPRNERRGRRGRIGSAGDGRGDRDARQPLGHKRVEPLDLDPADGEGRKADLPPHRGEELFRGVPGEGFGRRGETGADPEIIGPAEHGTTGLGQIVRRASHDGRRPGDATDAFEGEVVGAEVDAVGPAGHGDVGAVIDDDESVAVRTDLAGQFDRQPHPADQSPGGERFIADLDHPHPGLEEAADKRGKRALVLTAIDQHAQRDAMEPIAGSRHAQRSALQVVEPVAEGFEARGELRPEQQRAFLKAAQGLLAAGGVGGDQISGASTGKRPHRAHARADIPRHIAEHHPVRKTVTGEHVGEVVTEPLGKRREVGIVEHEAEDILDHPQSLAGPVGRGVEGPPGTGRPSFRTGSGRGGGDRELLVIETGHPHVLPPESGRQWPREPFFHIVFPSPCWHIARAQFDLASAGQGPTLPPPFPTQYQRSVRPSLPPSTGVAVASIRYLTLLWPGLPWLWLRGSVAGLVLALAFGVAFDVAILLTWVWTELVSAEFILGLWAATAAIWGIATLSAVTTFPPPLPTGRSAASEALFIAARDDYLARDWLAAETKLRGLLVVAPTDGESQLLLATLLRRVGRRAESRTALEALARSDSGAPWLAVIRREISRLDIATPQEVASPPGTGDGDLEKPTEESASDLAVLSLPAAIAPAAEARNQAA